MSIQNQIYHQKDNNIFNILDSLHQLKDSYKDKILIFGSLIVLMFIFVVSVQGSNLVEENPFLPRVWGAMIGIFLLNFGKSIYLEIKRARYMEKAEAFLQKTLWSQEFTPQILKKIESLYEKGAIHYSSMQMVNSIIVERRLQSESIYSLSEVLKKIVTDELQTTSSLAKDSKAQSLHELAPNFFTKNS